MMQFGLKCSKYSKLLVDMFLEWYGKCTGATLILKNRIRATIAIEGPLSV